jgi:hypothetical protein
MNIKFVNLPNIPYMIADISSATLNVLKKEVIDIKKNKNREKFTTGLTGNGTAIQYRLKDKVERIFLTEVGDLMKEYNNNVSYIKSLALLTKEVPLVLGRPWINLQKKYEFLPNHIHEGALSYSCWINIPYDIKKELEGNKAQNHASLFSFLYNDILGRATHHNLHIDKTYEGKIIIFPATLTHCVYPFYTSNDYRVSVSGNASFLVN